MTAAGRPPPRLGERLPASAPWRWLWLPPLALVATWLLFLLLYAVIRPAEVAVAPDTRIESVRVVATQRPPSTPESLRRALDAPPPPPPAAPPALAGGALAELALPTMAVTPIEVGRIAMPVGKTLGGGPSLGASGVFGGFARGGGGGNGSGAGAGAGTGTGASWKGKPLVPISTARPQMPEWACKQKLAGWVEAVFTVTANGHVRDVRIVDADPRGVYEAAAVESISNWIYEGTGSTLEVRQRVPMDPSDCAYNWR